MVKKIIKNHFKFLLFFILVVIYVVFITSNLIFKSHYQIGLIDLKGYVDSFNIDGNKVSLIVKAKEKIIVNYYVDDVNSLNKYKSYQLGDYINVVGTLERPSHNTLKNGFNYNKYLMSNKIYYVLKADKIIKIKDNNKISYKLKNSLDKKINNLKSKDYVKAFILGDKTNLDEDIKISYQENGVSHLLAISGMHITLLAGIMLKILNKIHKKDNHLVVSLLLIVYAFLTNFTPSVIRATTFFIFSRFKINKINLLLLIASLLLIYNPYYIYNVGFIFSFVISLYLLIFGKLSNKFNNYFVKLFITSLICFIAGLPILINNFHMINLLSPILNLLFVPFVSIIIFPLCLLVLILPFLDSILVCLINILEGLSLICLKFNLNMIMKHMSLFIYILYYLIITFILIKPKYSYLLIIMLVIHANIKYFDNSNYLNMLDIGQGDSILIELKNNKNILIDTGGIVNYNKEIWKKRKKEYSLVKSKTIPYLKSLGISKLNYLVITHGDYDHLGEAINLINNFKVDKVILNSGSNNKLEKEIIDLLKFKKIKYEQISTKDIMVGSIKLHFINKKDVANENEDSLIIYTKIAKRNILLMGDAGKIAENRLMDAYNLPLMDILKVGHHGSKNSSGKLFIDFIKPKVALISAGLNNRFKHPNKEVIDILKDNQATTYVTSIDGSIRLNLKNLKIYTCSNVYANGC